MVFPVLFFIKLLRNAFFKLFFLDKIAFNDIRGQLDSKVEIYAFDFGTNNQVPSGMKNLDTLLDEASSSPIVGQRVNYGDKMLYIYTSGTTGLPKAVRD